jgi:peptide/nickel transport system substrate-binding protein
MCKRCLLLLLLLLTLLPAAACATTEVPPATEPPDSPEPVATPAVAPDPTPAVERGIPAFLAIAIDVPDRTGRFARFDSFGNVEGFDAALAAALAEAVGLGHELIVTPYGGVPGMSGIPDGLARGDFDLALAAIEQPESADPRLATTDPYLEVGQVVVVRANETAITSYRDISADMRIAVIANSISARAARDILQLPAEQIVPVEDSIAALQAVSDFSVRAAIVDSYDAETYTDRYYQRLKMVGAERSDWIAHKAYVIAVSAENRPLLDLLNSAIATLHTNGTVNQLADSWLVPDGTLAAAGESLIGTPPDRLLIGMVGQEGNLDPADRLYAPINWEIKLNTGSGLLGYTADNVLVPVLAAQMPEIGNNGLHYDFTLREGLFFPDGSPLSADAVKTSLIRSALSGNWFVNAFLKNSDGDSFADNDAIQVLDPLRIRFVLREPTAWFLSVLATPPWFITSPACNPEQFEPLRSCSGIGPYTLTDYEPATTLRLDANPAWPLTPPVMPKVELRFYPDSRSLREALSNEAIDIAWHGLTSDDRGVLQAQPVFRLWEGPGIFKSYLVFEHETEPWDDPRVRQAAALAVDREALATTVFRGERRPLYSPLPDGIPAAIPAQPERDLEQAIALLRAAGFSEARPAEVTLSYINDGRYTRLEEAYAEAIKGQLEETGLFRVTLNGAPWNIYRAEMSACNYGAFLLGWPPQGEPRYLEGMTWLSYFVSSTENICSNYRSESMSALISGVRNTPDTEQRYELYRAIQALWAEEHPTLDLTQELAAVMALQKVTAVPIDAMGMLRYDAVVKTP